LFASCTIVLAGMAAAQRPPSMDAKGCCCVVEGVAYRCTEKTQAECLALQPQAPVFPKIGDWKKAWDDYVAASEAQESKPSRGGWVFAQCAKDINPATGEPRGAPMGCCCMPKAKPTRDDRFDCKPGMTRFDCKADCSFFADGRKPSDCTWADGACKK